MADHIIRADELEVGAEFIIHSSVAGELADHYLTVLALYPTPGSVRMHVRDRNGDDHYLTVPTHVAATIYGGAR